MKPLTPATPHLIIMVGIPGAGKTTFAEKFAHTFQAPSVNLQLLQQNFELNDGAAHKVTAHLLNELLKTRRTIIYEGPSDTKADRTAVSKKAITAGYKPLLVWVQTESLEAKRRAIKRAKIGALSSSEFDAAIARFSPPAIAEKAVVISGKHTYTTQIKVVLKRLAGTPRPETPEPPRTRPSRTIILR